MSRPFNKRQTQSANKNRQTLKIELTILLLKIIDLFTTHHYNSNIKTYLHGKTGHISNKKLKYWETGGDVVKQILFHIIEHM